MSELRGIVRRSTSGANVIQFPLKPAQCVAAPDPSPRVARVRRGKTSAAYRISQIVSGPFGTDAPTAPKTVWGE